MQKCNYLIKDKNLLIEVSLQPWRFKFIFIKNIETWILIKNVREYKWVNLKRT